MDIISRIDELRIERGWSVNYLASEALLTQSTLNSMYKRRTPPKLDILESLCDAFGLTLAQFFQQDEARVLVTDEEMQLLIHFRMLPLEKRSALLTLIKNDF